MSTPVSCPPGPVSVRGSFAIYFLPQMEIQPLTKEMFKNKQAQRYREQMGGCQRQGVGVGEMGRSWPEGTNSVIILTSSRNLMYSMVTTANNTVSYTECC